MTDQKNTLLAHAIMKARAQQALRQKAAGLLAEKRLKKIAEDVTEYDVKKAVKKRLDAIGAYHHWPVATVYGNPGLDCVGVYRGRSFWIETKRPGKVPTTRQDITIARIRACGGEVFVVDSFEAAEKLFLGDM